jgi:hypothetical protein
MTMPQRVAARLWRCELTALPPLPRIELALRQATELFASELAHPSATAPGWNDFEWTMASATAVLHGVTPLLATTLCWPGPAQWQRFAAEQRHHTARRQQCIAGLLQRIDEESRRLGLAIMPLKGAALHALGVYCAGQRPMADIDLLVQERDAPRARGMLEALGYAQTYVTWKNSIFDPQTRALAAPPWAPSTSAASGFGEHARAAIKIELHTRIIERLPVVPVDISPCIFPANPQPGLNCYPSTLALISHLLINAAGNMVGRNLRMIQLHDIALLTGRMQCDDWARLAERHAPNAPACWWALPPLELVARYYTGAVPRDVLTALRRHWPRGLRVLAERQSISDVSYTRLRFDAFPGLVWCRSLSEKLGYVLSRIRPSREQLTMRASAAADAWVASTPWAQGSHRRRMFRWALARPPRPPAMHTVRCAMQDQAGGAVPPPPHRDEIRAATRKS